MAKHRHQQHTAENLFLFLRLLPAGRDQSYADKKADVLSAGRHLRGAEIALQQLEAEHQHADYFSFVPGGEPTLDVNLGKAIGLLTPYPVKISVIINASLLRMDEVKEDLMDADWVSVNLDAAEEAVWCGIGRPHGRLKHQDILNGIAAFSKAFHDTFVTETMLVDDLNDQDACVEKIAEQVAM